jgi:hypothetical protein
VGDTPALALGGLRAPAASASSPYEGGPPRSAEGAEAVSGYHQGEGGYRRGQVRSTEASRVYDGLIDPRPIDGGWSSVCPRHPGSLLFVRVSAGRLNSVRCQGADDCAELERLPRLAES